MSQDNKKITWNMLLKLLIILILPIIKLANKPFKLYQILKYTFFKLI